MFKWCEFLTDNEFFVDWTELQEEVVYWYKESEEDNNELYICMPKKRTKNLDFDSEMNLTFEEFPEWFQALFAKAKRAYEEQQKLRMELQD